MILHLCIYVLGIVIIWLILELDAALVRDRGWNGWVTTLIVITVLIPIGMLFSGPDGWGFWRQLIGAVICVFLLQWGTVIHEEQTGKPLIRLPKKEKEKVND